jgi:glycosyltransferase involved in cell wall biosynthesis
MTLVFWQNIISPHQVDLLEELGKTNNVVLIVEKKLDTFREKQSWLTDVPKNIKLIINPSIIEVIVLTNVYKDSTHIISGFFAYKLSSLFVIISYFKKLNVFVISEAVDWEGGVGKIKLSIRKVFSFIFKRKIKGVLATGLNSILYFKKLGFSENKIHRFGYFVDVKSKGNITGLKNSCNLIFVGRLVHYKGITQFLDVFSKLKKLDPAYHLEVVGSGILKPSLINKISTLGLTESDIKFTSNIERSKVLEKIECSDLLVIPNVSEEGWGVVVNEALLLGTPVICTRHTGAHVIIDTSEQGRVVDAYNHSEIINAILSLKKYDRDTIKEIANNKISPKVISPYLLNIISDKEQFFTPWFSK